MVAMKIRSLRRRVKFYWDHFNDMIDSELVTAYQIIFYILIMINGLYTIWSVEKAPSALNETLAFWQFEVFTWMSIFAPMLTIIGKAMKRLKAGAIFELTGDLGFLGVSLTWVIAAYDTATYGKALFPTTYVLAACLCCLLFILRDFNRLGEKDRWVKV